MKYLFAILFFQLAAVPASAQYIMSLIVLPEAYDSANWVSSTDARHVQRFVVRASDGHLVKFLYFTDSTRERDEAWTLLKKNPPVGFTIPVPFRDPRPDEQPL